MADQTEKMVSTLAPVLQRKAIEFVNTLRDYDIPVIITSARRSSATQKSLVLQGRSSTLNSRHLTGMAFDMDILGMSRDSIPRYFWDIVGPWAEIALGLKWGGRWRTPYDPGHFEL